MARKPKQTDENTNSTVEARRAAEAERQAAAAAERANIMADTTKAKNETAKRLDTKPTDSRTIA
jgi:hypothetical protein